MKIRIKGNSIRIRLTRPEVDEFARTGYLEERTEFGNNLFLYALRSDANVTDLSASFVGIKMTMHVPANIPAAWAVNETVGYSNTMDTGNGKHLFLLLEKDFKCIDAPPNEDQSDNFENPNKVC